MKIKTIFALFVVGALAACGPGKSAKTAPEASGEAPAPISTGPEYDSIGVIATVEGQMVTLDHEGASAAKLAAGRTAFLAYADVLAEAPVTPGARVTFKFHKAGDVWDLTQLKTR
uniref:Copper-binding protein n=1 Tax=Caulobacter sp. (strain K31) TaxID=366602 RepID=B0T3P6_CAUSK